MKVRKATEGEVIAASPSRAPSFSVKRAHPTYSVEPCPNCGHPEADGGHCQECGWTRSCGVCTFCTGRASQPKTRKKKEGS